MTKMVCIGIPHERLIQSPTVTVGKEYTIISSRGSQDAIVRFVDDDGDVAEMSIHYLFDAEAYHKMENSEINPQTGTKACPYCGTYPEVSYDHSQDDYYCGCASMDCLESPATSYFKNEPRAIIAWNNGLVN